MKLSVTTSMLATMASLSEAFDQYDKILLDAKDLVSHQNNIQTLAHSHSDRHLQEACTEAYNAASTTILFGDVCTVVDGVCPDTCQAELDALNDVCEGQTYIDSDGVEQTYDHETEVLTYKILLEDACADTVDVGDATITCDGAYSSASFSIIFGDTCAVVDGMCPGTCQEALDNLNDVCEGQSYIDADGIEQAYDHALEVAAFKLLLEEECSAVVNIGDAEASCEGTFLAVSGDIVLGSTCDEATDGTCPVACTEMVKDLHELCEGEKLDDGEGNLRTYAPNEIAAAFQSLLEGACATADFSAENSSATLRAFSNSVVFLGFASLLLVVA